jgi:hypothetical protein
LLYLYNNIHYNIKTTYKNELRCKYKLVIRVAVDNCLAFLVEDNAPADVVRVALVDARSVKLIETQYALLKPTSIAALIG